MLQWRGEFAEADRLFTQANSTELPDRLRATMHQHAGKCAYDQGRYIEACNHFEKALDLRKEDDPELIAPTELALDAVFRPGRASGAGARTRAAARRSCRPHKPPPPAFDEQTSGGATRTPTATWSIGARYADVQPFRDGVAWVRPAGLADLGADRRGRRGC